MLTTVSGFSTMKKDEIIIKLLEDLDMDETESRLYLLLQSGSRRIGAITSDLKIDRNVAYRALLKLRNTGLIVSTLANPPFYEAINPEEALQTILRRREESLLRVKKTSAWLIKELKKRRSKISRPSMPFHSIIQGKQNIYSRISSLINHAKGNVYLVMPEEEYVKLYHNGIPEAIENRINKTQTKVLAITTLEKPESLQFITEIPTTETRIRNIPSKGILVLEEKNKLIISNGFESKTQVDKNTAIYTNQSVLVTTLQSFYKTLWKTSKPINPLINRT